MKYKEIYRLGEHRVMCGDATRRDDVMSLIGSEHIDLVLTDPPYGNRDVQKAKTGSIGEPTKHLIVHPNRPNPGYMVGARSYPAIIGNDSTEAARGHYEIAKTLTDRFILWGGHHYADFLPLSRGWLFWDKRTGTSDFGDGELAWSTVSNKIRKYTHLWSGLCTEGNCKLNFWGQTTHGKGHRYHPTQKPVELHARLLEDFTKEGDVVLDCFGGSGTTLIACEVTKRRCLMMEISLEYCEIIIERYRALFPFSEIERIA